MALHDKIGEVMRAFSGSKHHHTTAIIVAAGNGSRMNSNVTKQMLDLCGIPVVIRSVIPFEESEYIDEIIIVAREDEVSIYPSLLKKYNIEKVTKIIAGGETRQESVLKGFCEISDETDFIAIHDGARPLITAEQIKKVVLAGFDRRSATAGVKSKDTVKLSALGDFVDRTLDRDKVWIIQTPQVFYADLYRAAISVSEKDNFKATDDCSIVEHAGFTVKLVDCGYSNIKITSPEDLIFAEAIIKNREDLKKDE